MHSNEYDSFVFFTDLGSYLFSTRIYFSYEYRPKSGSMTGNQAYRLKSGLTRVGKEMKRGEEK